MNFYDNIKAPFLLSLCLICFLAGSFTASAQQQEKQPELWEQAEAEANRLQKLLDLDDWQVFYVDSTLKHDLPAMMAEYDKLSSSKVSNTMLYQTVHDKWMEQIDATYKKIFSPEQWAAYLKTGAAKAQKAREKRRAKAQQN